MVGAPDETLGEIGVAFVGNPKHPADRRRSIPIEFLDNLTDVAGVSFINLHTTGVILMVVGALGLILSVFFWASARSRDTPPEPGPRL